MNTITDKNARKPSVLQQKGSFFQAKGKSTFFGVAQQKSFFSPTVQPKRKAQMDIEQENTEGLTQLQSLQTQRDGGDGTANQTSSKQALDAPLVPYQFRQSKKKRKELEANLNSENNYHP